MNELPKKIAAEIACRGAIPFSRFMELALYCPVYGYYEKEADTLGRRGDYYTSVSVGKTFGELLAFQFADWLRPCTTTRGGLEALDSSETMPARAAREVSAGPVQILEAGAHRGDLAKDILRWFATRAAELFANLEYWLIEPSETRQAWQQQNLRGFSGKVLWARSLADFRARANSSNRPSVESPRILFSNELLDSFPVRRLGWDAARRSWFEWGVALEGSRFIWTRLPRTEMAPPTLPLGLLEVLPDGFTLEWGAEAAAWWRQAAVAVGSGKLLALDYGLTEEELLIPERRGGTLRAYHRHRLNADVLASPGEQDITSHVNFSVLREIGESAGLETLAFVTQAQFLTGIASRAWSAQREFGDWTQESTRQFQTLTHPEFLGTRFRVLLQTAKPAPGEANS